MPGHRGLQPFPRHQTGKVFKGAVIGTLSVPVKTAGRKFTHLQMILKAVATGSLAAARFVGAVAPIKVCFLLAFRHISGSFPLSFFHCVIQFIGAVRAPHEGATDDC
jgi:hypothetical protein